MAEARWRRRGAGRKKEVTCRRGGRVGFVLDVEMDVHRLQHLVDLCKGKREEDVVKR